MHLPEWIVADLNYKATNNNKLKVLNKESDKMLSTYFCLINSDQNNIFLSMHGPKLLVVTPP